MANITPIEEFRGQLAHRDIQTQILNYFGGDEDVTRKFMSSAVHVCRTVPELLKCNRASLMEALITCADVKLFPSSVSGEAYILPYAGEAKFQLGYQGLITLFYKAGVQAITSKIVYSNEKFEYEEGLNPRLIHIPLMDNRGEAVAVYAIADLNTKRIFHVMSKADVMKIKDMSKAKNSKFSPWNTNDPELWMWRKTCIKQLGKVLPKNETIAKAIDRDNQDSIVSERKTFDAKNVTEGAPTMGSLQVKNKKHGEEKKDSPQKNLDFGVAGNFAEGAGYAD